MRLLKLDDRVQQMVIDEMLSTGHARAILGIENPDKQYETAQKIFDEKLSVRDTEKLVKNLQNEKKAGGQEEKKIDPKMQAIYKDLEEQMKGILGTKVAINPKNEKSGRLEIEYYSQDELDRIIDLLRTIH
jgi:ParB family chromosome partitioning protein